MVQLPNNQKQICKISSVFIFLATFIVVTISAAITGVRTEVKILSTYLANAASIQPNYEQSLHLYTNQTETIIEYLLSLRPKNKEQFVKFINAIEAIGEEDKLNLEINSIKGEAPDPKKPPEKALYYQISFYGTDRDLINFLNRMQTLDYYVNAYDIRYRNPNLAGEKGNPNVNLKIKLYIK